LVKFNSIYFVRRRLFVSRKSLVKSTSYVLKGIFFSYIQFGHKQRDYMLEVDRIKYLILQLTKGGKRKRYVAKWLAACFYCQNFLECKGLYVYIVLTSFVLLWINFFFNIQFPSLNWITDNRIRWHNVIRYCRTHYTSTVHKTHRLIESVGYCYLFYVGPKWSY